LGGVIDIPFEQDEAEGALRAQKRALARGQGQTGYAGDESAGCRHQAD
jgi:hypothetical protein